MKTSYCAINIPDNDMFKILSCLTAECFFLGRVLLDFLACAFSKYLVSKPTDECVFNCMHGAGLFIFVTSGGIWGCRKNPHRRTFYILHFFDVTSQFLGLRPKEAATTQQSSTTLIATSSTSRGSQQPTLSTIVGMNSSSLPTCLTWLT